MGTDERVAELLAEWERAGRKPAAEQLCAGFPELAEAVRARIADRQARPTTAPEQGDAPRSAAAAPASGADEGVPALPHEVGPYRVLSLLGEGGMGSVYRAEQRSPIRRVIAVKVVKSGFDTKEVIARFQSERQALARMDHPNIARVLDAGATGDTGRPYFVMEYVPGLPLARFCDDNKLSIAQRLELFCQVCDAISHAHTKAILHRDIKSSNVLAYTHDGVPSAKVIDFGIAKALAGDRLTDLTFVTDQGRPIGTYDSMSPEQADGSPDIDTRTDVYSLGVLLYELLAGAKPFDRQTLANAGDHEIRRIISEVDPPRLDTRLGSLGEATATRVATMRQESLPQLTEALRGELGWIPLKAMRKERARRYESPRQLADDIRNYLERRPLIAGPESQAYRMRKWVSRYRYPVGGVVGSILVLLTATAVSIYFAKAARHTARLEAEQRRRADANAALAEAHAAKLSEQAAQLNRQLADFYTQKATALFDAGRRPQALLWLARAIELEEKDPRPTQRASFARVSFQTVLAQLPRMYDPVGLPLHSSPVVNGKTWVDVWGETPGQVNFYVIDAASKKRLTKAMSFPNPGPVPSFSADGRRLLMVGPGDAFRVWDVETAEPLTPPITWQGSRTRGAFSPDGTRILLIADPAAEVRDAATGAKLRALPVENPAGAGDFAAWPTTIDDACFGHDGASVHTGWSDGTVATWDAATGQRRGTDVRVEGRPGLLTPSPDGRWLAVRHREGRILTLIDLITREPHVFAPLPTAVVDAMQFTPDGTRLLVYGGSAEVGVFDVPTRAPVLPVRHLGWWPRKAWLADDGNSFWVWDDIALCHYRSPTGVTPPMRHEHDHLWHASFSPDGTRILTAGGGRTARVWDATTGHPVTPWLTHEDPVRSAVFDPSGRRVLVATEGPAARVYDARTGELSLSLPTPEGGHRASFSPDGSRIAVACDRTAVRLFDAATGKPLASEPILHRPRGAGETVNAAAFSPDNRQLAIGSELGTTLWRQELEGAWRQVAELSSGDVGKSSLAFTPDGTRLLGCDGVFDAATGLCLVDFLQWTTESEVSHATLSPDGRLAAFADGTEWAVRVADVVSGKIVSPIMPHKAVVMSVAFSRDAELLATASADGFARVFHVRTGRLIASIEFTRRVQQASFSPDGKRLLVACDDGTATLWDLEPETRPVADLRRLAEVMAWNVIDEFDSVVLADGDELEKAWKELVARYPDRYPKMTSLPTTRPAATGDGGS